MARPRKLGLDWFPFHANTFDDRKMLSLISRRGSSAFALLIFLKSEIFHNSYFVEADDFLMEKALRHFSELDEVSYTSLLDTFVEWGFFDNTTYLAHKVLTSVDIQHDYFYVADRRKIDPEQLKYLLVEFPITEENSKETAKKTAKNSSKKSTKKTSKKQQSNEVQSAEYEHDSESSGVSACKRREDKSRKEKIKHNFEKNYFSQSVCEKEEEKVFTHTLKKEALRPAEIDVCLGEPDYIDPYKNEAYYPVERISNFLLNEVSWKEPHCMANSLKMEEFDSLIEEFLVYYLARFNPKSNTKMLYTNYFLNWLRLKMKDRRDDARNQQQSADRQAKFDARMAQREANYVARMAQRDANHAARMEAREAKYDARMERRDAKFDARFEQQKRSQPHQFECEKNYVPRLNIITFGKDVPTESGFDLPDFNQA
jgi:hypothetical protein